jgi:hypothetical protein
VFAGVTTRDIVGYRVLGTRGELGVVVDLPPAREPEPEVILVQGGVSNSLTFHVPTHRVRSLSRESRTIYVDIDLLDFIPRLDENGAIELRAPS